MKLGFLPTFQRIQTEYGRGGMSPRPYCSEVAHCGALGRRLSYEQDKRFTGGEGVLTLQVDGGGKLWYPGYRVGFHVGVAGADTLGSERQAHYGYTVLRHGYLNIVELTVYGLQGPCGRCGSTACAAGGKGVRLGAAHHARGERQILWADGPNRESDVAVAGAPVVSARIEVQAEGVAAVARERTRPEAAPAASKVELGTGTVAGGRHEDGVAVRAFHFVAVLAILRGPRPGAVV